MIFILILRFISKEETQITTNDEEDAVKRKRRLLDVAKKIFTCFQS